MPPKVKASNQLIIKAKRQASIYFLLVLNSDTFLTLKNQIVSIVNKSGGMKINDLLTPLENSENGNAELQAPVIGGGMEESSDEEDDTNNTAPMTTNDTKQLSVDEIQLGLLDASTGEITELDANDETKLSSFNWKDFTTVVFKLEGEEFQIFSNEYGV